MPEDFFNAQFIMHNDCKEQRFSFNYYQVITAADAVEYHEKEDELSYRRSFPSQIRQMLEEFDGQAQLQEAARKDALHQFEQNVFGYEHLE